MIYEVFNCVTGNTVNYVFGEELAKALKAKYDDLCLDYEPADIGFYVVASIGERQWIVAKHFAEHFAERNASLLNQASDTVTYHVLQVA